MQHIVAIGKRKKKLNAKRVKLIIMASQDIANSWYASVNTIWLMFHHEAIDGDDL